MLRPIVITMTLGVILVVPLRAPADLTPANSRKTFPEVAFEDAKGAPVKLSAYKGRVLVLDFWATWCEGCKEEIPWYMEFQDKYKKNGLEVVGVSMDDDGWTSVKPYLEEHKINYRIVIGKWESAKPFGADKGLPVTLLIDRDGKIAALHAGMVNKDAIEREIQALLKEPAK